MEVVVWTDDVPGAVEALGAPVLSPPHDWLDGRLVVAWVADPDGNAVQLVQKTG
jgi:predicted enzyme related to lactoylglutathione lyase